MAIPYPSKKIHVVDDFLSREQCRQFVSGLDRSDWMRSTVHGANGPYEINHGRTSQTQHFSIFSKKSKKLISEVELLLSTTFNYNPSFLEEWQVTKYGRGEYYDYHVDSGSQGRGGSGLRTRTFLIYLTTHKTGGETHFRAFDLKIPPREGRLVVWNNLLASGDTDYSMIHSGLPPLGNEKIILVTWERQGQWR